MKWVKLGRVIEPKGQYDWLISHAMLPVADHIEGDIYRIYFSGRDKNNISRIGYLVVDINKPKDILELSKDPVVDVGSLGCYDDNGVSPTCLVTVDDKKYLYIMGWNKGSRVRAAEVSGLAISYDSGLSFSRYSNVPVLERTTDEPYTILVISSIIIENGVWRMWYDSADYWIDETLPKYNIKYAESTDGINWIRKKIVAVDYLYENETRVSRACVVKKDNLYQMWYCYAIGTGGYNMGYGVSEDGYSFQRKDKEVGITLSDSGWDSEMICYPHVFNHKGHTYMLYCGNGYGRTGFGIAKLMED